VWLHGFRFTGCRESTFNYVDQEAEVQAKTLFAPAKSEIVISIEQAPKSRQHHFHLQSDLQALWRFLAHSASGFCLPLCSQGIF